MIAAFACNAPHIPLPPPSAEDILVEAGAGPGLLAVRAEPQAPRTTTSFPPFARVDVINYSIDPAEGAIRFADENGVWEAEIRALDADGDGNPDFGDELWIQYFDTDGTESDVLCVRATDGRQSVRNDCAAGP